MEKNLYNINKKPNELNTITAALQTVGNMIETARIRNNSLSEKERAFINTARLAARQRFSQQMINTIENEGAEIARAFVRR